MNTMRSVLPCISRGINSVLNITRCQSYITVARCQNYQTVTRCTNYPLLNRCMSRSLTVRHPVIEPQTHAVNNIACSGVLLSKINSVFHQPVRFYKAKRVLRLRCKGCYFERRFDRLYVECSLKPRHKQMKIVNKKYVYKDDYSEGQVREAAHWNYRTVRFYRIGKNKFSRYNWLEGRLGTEI